MQVKDIVKKAVIVSESDSFATALDALNTKDTNTLLVTDKHGKLSGEVTVADLLDVIIPDTLDGSEVVDHFSSDDAFIASIGIAKDLPVAEFMTKDFSPLTLNDNLTAIISTAITHQRARIPVVDQDDRPIGIISRQGLKKILAKFMEAS